MSFNNVALKKIGVSVKWGVLLVVWCFLELAFLPAQSTERPKPKVVNIVNFIRLLEPRDAQITEQVLYETVVSQVKLMDAYNLKGTFLLQYDALMDGRYQTLLGGLPGDRYEIGAWWEIPQPLVEKAGLEWRGRYPWDWHADVGFSTGYTPAEREKLVDVYMADFKAIFGDYPKSVASWFIDAHTLNYMYEKYHIVASANCKDQYGTDGYTLWGGYWNQAYYPSKINSYMPAQTVENQTPVPIFRMLGSDPVRQYDTGVGHNRQGVITLEPVYSFGGGDQAWVDWFFRELIEGESMEFAYTQAGQENSFTWAGMAKGLEYQFPLIAKLRDEGKLSVQTLGESGAWFRDTYEVTPATSMTVNDDLGESKLRTVWFNSRFYRTNLLWEEDGSLRIRDIHLFNEHFPSVYTTGVTKTNECHFYTLPVVDGYLWSDDESLAGMRLKALVDGEEVLLKGGTPKITSARRGRLDVSWPLTNVAGQLEMRFVEDQLTVSVKGNSQLDWYFDMEVPKYNQVPFTDVLGSVVQAEFDDFRYELRAHRGTFTVGKGKDVLRISPHRNRIQLDMATPLETTGR
ncbi:hypothetical protein [Parapedobacter sp. 2B3]|uniref:hypothetical protein n=1 Tax=Parapedobacter sp. 2B3 TaxID=3342381 RepID=UPI0035B69197